MEAGGRSVEERRYVHLAPETVTNVAESLGIHNLSAGVAKELAEDVTYRLREIADVCSQFLRHSRKRKLTTDIVNKALKVKKIAPVIGHKKNRILGCDSFEYLPEGDIYIESDREINLVSESLQGESTIQESQVNVTASWISVQGVSLNTAEDGKVNPTQTSLTPILHQYYTTATSHLLGDSQELCLSVLQDLRQNPRLTPLLPYLVTFSRLCITRYKDNVVITGRLIRLISALFSNPHINLSPKPYLSYLVSALLGFLIKENKEGNPVQHVQLAACVLSQALQRWATPTNQLRAQTLRALKDNSVLHLSYSQYGSLVSLTILGPEVIEECILPQFESLLSSLWTLLHSRIEGGSGPGATMGSWSYGLLLLAGSKLLQHWRSCRRSNTNILRLYTLLEAYYGDALVPFLRATGVGRTRRPRDYGKMRLRRIRQLGCGASTAGRSVEAGFAVEAPPQKFGNLFSGQDNFNYLADMGLPSDIFEPNDIESAARGTDFSSYFKGKTVAVSKNLMWMFPDAKPFRFKPKAIRLNLGPCRQMEPDRYTQKKPAAPSSGRRMVAWRNLAVGGRRPRSTQQTNRYSFIPNYSDLLVS